MDNLTWDISPDEARNKYRKFYLLFICFMAVAGLIFFIHFRSTTELLQLWIIIGLVIGLPEGALVASFFLNEIRSRAFHYGIGEEGVQIQINNSSRLYAWDEFSSYSLPQTGSASSLQPELDPKLETEHQELQMLTVAAMPLAKKIGKNTIALTLAHPNFFRDRTEQIVIMATDTTFDQAVKLISAKMPLSQVVGRKFSVWEYLIIFLFCLIFMGVFFFWLKSQGLNF